MSIELKKRCFICNSKNVKYSIPNALTKREVFCSECKDRVIKSQTEFYENIFKNPKLKFKLRRITENLNYIINNVKEI